MSEPLAQTGYAETNSKSFFVEMRRMLQSRGQRLVAIAARDETPVDELGLCLSDLRDGEYWKTEGFPVDAAELVKDAEQTIAEILRPAGYVPLRRKDGPIANLQGIFPKTIYVRPAEQALFDPVDAGDSVVLAISQEPARFARALIDRYRASERERPVYIWSSGSGIYQVAGHAPDYLYFRLGEKRHRISTVSDHLEECVPEKVLEFRKKLLLEGKSDHCFKDDDAIVTFWVSSADVSSISLECVVDVFDTEGRPPTKIDLREAAARGNLIEMGQKFVEAYLQKTNGKEIDLGKMSGVQDLRIFGMLIQLIVDEGKKNALYILHDAHRYLAESARIDPAQTGLNIAVIRDANIRLRRAGSKTQIVLLAPEFTPPVELSAGATIVELPLPGRRELYRYLSSRLARRFTESANNSDDPLLPQDDIRRIADAAAGITLNEVNTVLRRLSAENEPQRFVDEMTDAKKRSLRRSPALELVEVKGRSRVTLGGMEEFVTWLRRRGKVFENPDRAQMAGIDRRPKGVLLLGIPGTGKSLAAKVIAEEWKMPLVRLDMGALRDKYVGSTEERTRSALAIIQAMAPCILWIDEIDKGLAQGDGTSSHSTDLNLRATLLTWMQENRTPVFTVATANRFENLPPELTRAGRFDARFFFGCPDPEGRREIFRIHIGVRNLAPNQISEQDWEMLLKKSHGFTGAEIEQVVLDALYAAFEEDRPVNGRDLVNAASIIKPIVQAVGKGLEEAWSLIDKGRVTLASKKFLPRSQLLMLIDPTLYSPMYCRKPAIHGWEQHSVRAERLLMNSPLAVPAIVILDAGDPEWVFVQSNIRNDARDEGHFKFLDRIATLEKNGVFDTLVIDYAIEVFLFEKETLQKQFAASPVLSQYIDYFQLVESARVEEYTHE